MPRAYLPSCFTFLFAVVISLVADSQSSEEGSSASLWSGCHVTAKSVTAASVGDRAKAAGHAEVWKDVSF